MRLDMRLGALSGTCLVTLLASAAFAQDKPLGTTACEAALIETEALVNARIEAGALSEVQEDKINMLLDEADALCTEGKTQKVRETLATVTKLASGQ
jgi:hypothetical protein